jgi:hypothetical protein
LLAGWFALATLLRVHATWSEGRVFAHRRRPRHAADRRIDVGLSVALVLSLALVAAQFIDFAFRLHSALLNSDTHASAFGIISLLAQGAVVVAAAVVARRSPRRKAWLMLGALLLALLVIRIWVGYKAWLLLVPLAIAATLCWQLAAGGPARTRTIIRAGLALLTLSFLVHAVGVKVVHGLGYGADTWPYQVKAAVKHASELAGWLLLATGITACLPPTAGALLSRRT